MATVRVSVISALTGQELIAERIFDCEGCVQMVRAELGHRPVRPVKLMLYGWQIDEDFVPTGERPLQFTAIWCAGLKEEVRDSLLQQLQDAGDAWRAEVLFRGASDAARDDAAVVRAAVRRNPRCLVSAGAGCRSDRQLVLDAARQKGFSLRFAPQVCADDEEIMLEAVRQDGANLQFAGQKCRNKEEIVLEAVRQGGANLQFAGQKCRNKEEIVREAVRQDKDNWRHCGWSLYATVYCRSCFGGVCSGGR